MGINSITSHFRGNLSTVQTLDLANIHLDNAHQTTDRALASVLCDDADSALTYVRRVAKWMPKYSGDKALQERIGAAFVKLGHLQDKLGDKVKSQASYKKAGKLGYVRLVRLSLKVIYSI